jgi:hypothetical protein
MWEAGQPSACSRQVGNTLEAASEFVGCIWRSLRHPCNIIDKLVVARMPNPSRLPRTLLVTLSEVGLRHYGCIDPILSKVLSAFFSLKSVEDR